MQVFKNIYDYRELLKTNVKRIFVVSTKGHF